MVPYEVMSDRNMLRLCMMNGVVSNSNGWGVVTQQWGLICFIFNPSAGIESITAESSNWQLIYIQTQLLRLRLRSVSYWTSWLACDQVADMCHLYSSCPPYNRHNQHRSSPLDRFHHPLGTRGPLMCSSSGSWQSFWQHRDEIFEAWLEILHILLLHSIYLVCWL